MHQRQGTCLAAERDGPIERGIAATANHEIAVMKIGGRLHPIMDALPFEFLDARHAQSPRLKRPHAGRDHHRTGNQARTGGGYDENLAVGQAFDFRHFLSEMEGGIERLRLVEEPID